MSNSSFDIYFSTNSLTICDDKPLKHSLLAAYGFQEDKSLLHIFSCENINSGNRSMITKEKKKKKTKPNLLLFPLAYRSTFINIIIFPRPLK